MTLFKHSHDTIQAAFSRKPALRQQDHGFAAAAAAAGGAGGRGAAAAAQEKDRTVAARLALWDNMITVVHQQQQQQQHRRSKTANPAQEMQSSKPRSTAAKQHGTAARLAPCDGRITVVHQQHRRKTAQQQHGWLLAHHCGCTASQPHSSIAQGQQKDVLCCAPQAQALTLAQLA